MSFARALSRRYVASRSDSKRHRLGEISLPIGLLSSSNALAFDAPDIDFARARAFSDASASSGDEYSSSSDHELAPTAGSSATSSPNTMSPAMEFNHLTEYFPGPARSKSTTRAASTATDELHIPAVPRRAPSHSKREHERLARVRSFRRSAANSPESSPVVAQASTFDQHLQISPPGEILQSCEQITESAEEQSHLVHSPAEQQDIEFMRSRGLSRHRPQDYIALVFPSSPFEVGFFA